MAAIVPTFLTGATAKIRLNGKTMAFCQDFRCSIQILTQTPKVLGKYEADSVEPLGYLVSGGFTIIRYAKGIREASLQRTAPGIAENDAGNGVGNWGTAWGGGFGDFAARNGIGNDGRAHEALDPSKFAKGTTFDIQVYQKVAQNVEQDLSGKVADVLNMLNGGSLPWESSGPGAGGAYLGILNIRNARITQADFGLQKRTAASERFSFVAIYVDGDGFVANQSG